jgi:hypothetical protein
MAIVLKKDDALEDLHPFTYIPGKNVTLEISKNKPRHGELT